MAALAGDDEDETPADDRRRPDAAEVEDIDDEVDVTTDEDDES